MPSDAEATIRRKLEQVRRAQRALDTALGRNATPNKIENCRRDLELKQRALTKARRAAGLDNTKRAKHPARPAAKLRRRSSAPNPKTPKPRREEPQSSAGSAADRQTWIDTGVRFSEDPDASRRTVWVFKTGSTFHRRDCQVVESRDGAIEIPVAKAKKRNLTRCMHRVPTVR